MLDDSFAVIVDGLRVAGAVRLKDGKLLRSRWRIGVTDRLGVMLRVLLGVAYASTGVRDGLRVASADSSGTGKPDAENTLTIAVRVLVKVSNAMTEAVMLSVATFNGLYVGATLDVAVPVSGTLTDGEIKDDKEAERLLLQETLGEVVADVEAKGEADVDADGDVDLEIDFDADFVANTERVTVTPATVGDAVKDIVGGSDPEVVGNGELDRVMVAEILASGVRVVAGVMVTEPLR
jgi:hypothetical protein